MQEQEKTNDLSENSINEDQEDIKHQETEDVDNSKQTIEDLSKQVESLQDKLLRQLAESENIRTRSAKMIDEGKAYAIFGFAKDLVPILDNLSKALDHLPETLEDDVKNLVEGIRMTKKEFESIFQKHSLESIKPQSGDKFDYNLHHAISQTMTNDYESGTIIDTMQVGYKLKDRLIRPASVIVAKNS